MVLQKHKSIDFARVSVFFQIIEDNDPTSDDYQVIPGSNFVVSRYVYKDNRSRYFLNQDEVKFNEVIVSLTQKTWNRLRP